MLLLANAFSIASNSSLSICLLLVREVIKDDSNSLSIYLSSLAADAQGIHLVVGLEEEETLDEKTGVAIFVNPECDSSHVYRSANTYSSHWPCEVIH